ncbi:MAG: hypothetical protein KGQ41_07035, partial [Alphaproteobacteria bacterium]|nr:hypothetical protein [Alphaproteobacteria bacterium]
GEDPDEFPSAVITNGSLDNLLKLMQFGRRVVLKHRDVLADEVILRMNTLVARGDKTPADAGQVIARVNKFRDAEAASELCEGLMLTREQAIALLVSRGAYEPPADASGPAQQGRWRIPLLPDLKRFATSMPFL